MDKILILDFGSQTTQLIGRRIREIGVYSEIIAGDAELTDSALEHVKGIILSGSPWSVYQDGAPAPDPRLYVSNLPVLGICYGLQRITKDMGGVVEHLGTTEFGRAKLHFKKQDPLFQGVRDGFVSWMSHGDSIKEPAAGFSVIAESENGFPAALAHTTRKLYGIQFHPEVTHCEYGITILENFACGICGAKKEWSMDLFLEQSADTIRKKIGKEKVLLLISGGVDSTVAGGLLLRTLDPEQVHLMYINTGLMRKGESEEVESNLKELGARHLYFVDARKRFLAALKGIEDPEKKRKIIGDLFITVQEEEIRKRRVQNAFLAQGTLYTDLIESGKGVGTKAHVIKSHHNVRSPLVERKRASGLIVEPLDRLYKDEVRALGLKLGIHESIVNRHPFPGPGLAVRILGEVTEEKCDILREADALFISELKKRGLYDAIWQAFCVLLPVKSVGVAGDVRAYGYVLSLRAVTSKDGMTADAYCFHMNDLLEISSLITNSVKHVGRVVYDISSKPPATIEWE